MTRVLGFDTATAVVAVAATENGAVVHQSAVGPAAEGQPRHATALLVEIAATVERLGGWEGIDRIAVGVGPGSFTGLRIGVATGRALSQALDRPLTPVETLATLAAGIGELPQATDAPRLPLIDARRGELFAALHDSSGARIWGPEVITPGELGGRVAAMEDAPVAAGDGSLRFRSGLTAAGAIVPDEGDAVHRVAAGIVCRLAEDVPPAPPEAVEPLYLRAPDAEKWLERNGL